MTTPTRPILRSQRLRLINHQGDALRLGMNWTEEDLGKPQVLVDSVYGMGHPGTFHFRELIEEVSNGVYEAGGKPAVFAVSDICDGVIQATSGMSYSLVSRDIMAAMVEIHALGHPHDGIVLISGNDKSVPAHLVAIACCDLPAIHLPGGTQLNAPDYVTSDKMWEMGAEAERGELPRQDLETAQRNACPTCGACQFMGSASTGQVLAEALGLALPGSALTPARAISALTRCEVIARYGTGTDIVDVDAATRRGILVTNVPNDWCENEVADHAMTLLLGAARKICRYDQATRDGIWRWQTGEPIHRISGRTLGLLSFGAIAQAICRRAGGFGLRVIATDPYMPAADIADRGATPVSLEELLDKADYLVIQAPLTKETHHLIGEPELRRMKPTAILINTARGPIVSDQALYRALSEGWIAGAGLDDIEEEPAKQPDWTPANPLFGLDNVIITPHAAYYSEEAIQTVRDFAASEVVRVLTGQPALSPVNAVQIADTRRAAGHG